VLVLTTWQSKYHFNNDIYSAGKHMMIRHFEEIKY